MSHTKSTPAPQADFYVRYFEYARVISIVSVTEEGVYQAGQVPLTYGGSQLDLQVVNAVLMVNAKAQLQVLEFEVEPPMDKDRKTGGPIVRDGTQIRAKSGESNVPVIQTTIYNKNLESTRKQLGAAAEAAIRAAIAASGQPPL